MDYGESFYSVHLRLASFLRVVHHLFKRPSRFRKTGQQRSFAEHQDEDLFGRRFSCPVQEIDQIDRITITKRLEPNNSQSPELPGTSTSPKSSTDLARSDSENLSLAKSASCNDIKAATSDQTHGPSSLPRLHQRRWLGLNCPTKTKTSSGVQIQG